MNPNTQPSTRSPTNLPTPVSFSLQLLLRLFSRLLLNISASSFISAQQYFYTHYRKLLLFDETRFYYLANPYFIMNVLFPELRRTYQQLSPLRFPSQQGRIGAHWWNRFCIEMSITVRVLRYSFLTKSWTRPLSSGKNSHRVQHKVTTYPKIMGQSTARGAEGAAYPLFQNVCDMHCPFASDEARDKSYRQK